MSTALPLFFERLKQSLQKYPSPSLELGRLELREAAVLVPLFMRGDEPWAILTQRPQTLRSHPGQVSFPGGGRESFDVTPLHTALRETHEELGIPPEAVDVLGMLGTLPTITQYQVTPFVGVIPESVPLHPSRDEIEEVLLVPLLRARLEKREALGALRDAYVWPDSERFIWGATFRMFTQLLEHVHRAQSA